MDGIILTALESLTLVAALSVDAFAASFSYGAIKIKLPFVSMLVIDLICSGTLAVSLLLGSFVRAFLPAEVTMGVCFAILFFLGVIKLCDGAIKAYIIKRRSLHKRLSFSAFNLNFILHIYADPEKADQDSSKSLSPREAAALALALSFDGLAVGFGASLVNINVIEVVAFSLVIGMAAITAGGALGRKISGKTSDLSWLSGLILIGLAFLKLI